jgi:hypothetical protein
MRKLSVIMFTLTIGFALAACGGKQASSAPAETESSAMRGAGEIYAVISDVHQME